MIDMLVYYMIIVIIVILINICINWLIINLEHFNYINYDVQ